jgi:hypothetical protein
MEENNQNQDFDFNDVLDNFREAVFNGQVRLALEQLVTIVDVFVEVLSSDDEDKEPTKEEPIKDAIVAKDDKRETPLVAEEKPAATKKIAKETAEKPEE